MHTQMLRYDYHYTAKRIRIDKVLNSMEKINYYYNFIEFTISQDLQTPKKIMYVFIVSFWK